MSATDELRRMLDERGVKWWDSRYGEQVVFQVGEVKWFADDGCRDGMVELSTLLVTPEQAIAATLGGGECVPHGEWERLSQTQEVRHVFCECGNELGRDERDSFPFQSTRLCAIPNYCQECGRKIRKAVKR